jgi:activating signal cointegrator complex subunit 3
VLSRQKILWNTDLLYLFSPIDRVERLYLSGDIRVLVATATLAWGVNLPARLVIVKGTEYFDGKTSRYVDYPLTDVLQMIGRAGRPGFDTEGKAVVLVESSKKNFYMVRQSSLLEIVLKYK